MDQPTKIRDLSPTSNFSLQDFQLDPQLALIDLVAELNRILIPVNVVMRYHNVYEQRHNPDGTVFHIQAKQTKP